MWPCDLVGQGVGERDADRAVLVADQQVDVGDLVAVADQGFADEHGHECVSLGCKSMLDILRRNISAAARSAISFSVAALPAWARRIREDFI